MSRDVLTTISYQVIDLSYEELLELYNLLGPLIEYNYKLNNIMIPEK